MIADDGKTRILAVGMFMAAWRHIKGKGGRKSIKQFHGHAPSPPAGTAPAGIFRITPCPCRAHRKVKILSYLRTFSYNESERIAWGDSGDLPVIFRRHLCRDL